MKNKLLLVVVVVLSMMLIMTMDKEEKLISNPKIKTETIQVKNNETGKIESKELEEYVIGVVAAEMPASFSFEALKAQAIASRTYAYYKMKHASGNYDIIADVSNQAYINEDQMKEKWQSDFQTYYEKIKKAVSETKNEIMTYDGEVIESFYFAMSNGYTENVSAVFNEELPYLTSVESKWDNSSLNNYEVKTTFTKEEFCNKLEISCSKIIVSDQQYDDTGRTKEITINGKNFSGVQFRSILNLRSTDFELQIDDDTITIKTEGYGHGVGMSQYGANGMAKEGHTCYEILNYYYKDIEIKKI